MVLNHQKKVRLATRPLQEFLRKAQRELNIAAAEITVALVSDAEIAKWNQAYRKKSGPTDVLSFPATSGAAHSNGARPALLPPAAGKKGASAPQFLGDIAIAPETARRYATKNGRTLPSELRVLLLHGILHLLGYDHETDTGQMNRIERKLRRRLGLT